MHWVVLGVTLAFILAIYLKITEIYTNNFLKTFELRYFFIRLVLAFIGFACFISLIYTFNTCNNSSFKKNIFKQIFTKKSFGIIFLLTFLYLIYLYLYASCLKNGGNYTFVIMNFNIIFVFMFGYLFFKEKLTLKTISILLIFILSGGYLCIKHE